MIWFLLLLIMWFADADVGVGADIHADQVVARWYEWFSLLLSHPWLTPATIHSHRCPHTFMLRAVLVCKSTGVRQALRQAGAVAGMPRVRGEFEPGGLRREGAVAEQNSLGQS